MKKTVITILLFMSVSITPQIIFAQAPGLSTTTESNEVITLVGNPPASSSGSIVPSGSFSCPLVGKRTIGCGSFMSDPAYNRSACSGPSPEDRGHMGRSYVGIYYAGREATLQKRRAHSIDIDATPGEIVYLPTIEGKSVEWTYVASYAVDLPGIDNGGGTGHVFTAKLGTDRWMLHFVHMNPSRIPPLNGVYHSGDPVTTVADTSYDHLHVNLGKNPTGDNGGDGWLNPENLGMCVN